jgi:hypothetical protein
MPHDALPLVNSQGFILFGALEKAWFKNNYTEILTDLEVKEQCEILSIQKVALPDFEEVDTNNFISYTKKFNKKSYTSSTYLDSTAKAVETNELIKNISKKDLLNTQYVLTLVRKL